MKVIYLAAGHGVLDYDNVVYQDLGHYMVKFYSKCLENDYLKYQKKQMERIRNDEYD